MKQKKNNYESNYDSETGLKIKTALKENTNKYFNEKTTFVLIELNESIRNIYGNERLNKFFIEFSQKQLKNILMKMKFIVMTSISIISFKL